MVISSVCGMVFWVSVGQYGQGVFIEVVQGCVQVGNCVGQCLVVYGQVIWMFLVLICLVLLEVLLLVLYLDIVYIWLELLLVWLVWVLVDGVVGYCIEIVCVDQFDVLLVVQDSFVIIVIFDDFFVGILCVLLCVVSVDGVEGLDSECDFIVCDQLVVLIIVCLCYVEIVNSMCLCFEWGQVFDVVVSVLQIVSDLQFVLFLVEQDIMFIYLCFVQLLLLGMYYWCVVFWDCNGYQGCFGQMLLLILIDIFVDLVL